jgi:hypothetical protein
MQRLYNTDATVTIRSLRAVADAANWLPSAAADMLDAREWEAVRVTPVFRNGLGAIVDGTDVDITPLIAINDPVAGRVWRELTPVAGLTDEAVTTVANHGHEMAVRITAITLGAATTVDIVAVSGEWIPGRVS